MLIENKGYFGARHESAPTNVSMQLSRKSAGSLLVLLALVAVGLKLTAFNHRAPDSDSGASFAGIIAPLNDNTPQATDDNVAIAANFNVAAQQNGRLLYDLDWAFGGKPQRGWAIYVPLLHRELGIDKNPNTPEFAITLARWQASAKLPPTGVLDRDTLLQIIAAWQARRLNSHTPPPADQLLTAPVFDFYDPQRPDQLRQVERQTYAAYKRLVQAAAADPTLGFTTIRKPDGTNEFTSPAKFLKIISSYRSRAYQEQLRRASPHAGRAGLALNSPHFTGRALDVYVGGNDPVSTEDYNRTLQINTPVYRWLVKNAERFGFRPYFYEPWHWEYVGEPAPQIP